jgi:hypothetical protein
MSKGRGVYTRYTLSSLNAPLDPDPEDYAQGVTLDSIAMRMKDSFLRVPATAYGAT